MANTYDSYTDKQIMKALLTKDFSIIGRAFEDDKITKIKTGAFYKANNIDRVTLRSVTSVGALAFAESGISTLDLDWEKLECIGENAFADIDKNVLPNTLNLLKAVTIQNGAFSQASNAKANTVLKTVNAPLWTGDNLSSQLVITSARGIFAYCSALENVTAPELTAIPSNCFLRCSSLVQISLPKVSSYDSSVFSFCTNLVKVKFGGNIKNMNSNPFPSCTKLEALVLSGITAVPSISASNWSSSNSAKGSAYFYVPASLVNNIKVTSGWSTFADQIRAIEDYQDFCNF